MDRFSKICIQLKNIERRNFIVYFTIRTLLHEDRIIVIAIYNSDNLIIYLLLHTMHTHSF